jgi:hypothetical protein
MPHKKYAKKLLASVKPGQGCGLIKPLLGHDNLWFILFLFIGVEEYNGDIQ